MTFSTKFRTVLAVIIGMIGLRIDRGRVLFRVILLITGAAMFWSIAYLLGRNPLEVGLIGAMLAWVFYYGGMIVAFRSSLSKRWIARFGEEKAYEQFNILLGIAFFNQALAQSILISASENTLILGIPEIPVKAFAIVLMTVGFVTKVWATYRTGLETYYYKDLFLNRAIKHDATRGYVTKGPYRYFANPMYGVGNLQAYGGALWKFSIEGLLCSLIYQATIYIIYWWIEKPFFERVYKAKA